MAYSGEVDAALIATLLGDTTLMALVPDGVFVDVAAHGATRFVIVKLMTHTVIGMFHGRAFEQPVYLVKAVEFGTGSAISKAAAARIDVLLGGPTGQGSELTVTGYGTVWTALEEYVRYTEPDPENADTRWQHRGGLYRVMATPA